MPALSVASEASIVIALAVAAAESVSLPCLRTPAVVVVVCEASVLAAVESVTPSCLCTPAVFVAA